MLGFTKFDRSIHDRNSFTCNVEELDTFLKRFAGQNQTTGNSTTHVLFDSEQPSRILGFVTLSAAELSLTQLSEQDRKKLPRYPLPAIRIARLAVDIHERNKHYGTALLGFSVQKALDIRDLAGVRVLIVDAKNDSAISFYEQFGFKKTTKNPNCLFLFI